MSWKIWHKDGSALRDANGKEIEAHSLEYDGEWMGACAVTTTIRNEAPVEFEPGDWLEYRGERFELNYDPGKTKQARKDSYGEAFVYEQVKWNSLADELARAELLDVVLGKDNKLHYTALPSFSFYVETIDDLLDRLQANMDEQTGEGRWKIYSRNWARSEQRGGEKARWEEIYGGDADAEDTGVEDNRIDSTAISVDNQTVWEGLGLVNSQFDINFIVRNREVFVGTVGLPTRNVFRYGKGQGLYEIEQTADAEQKIVTRMRAYGSSKNLPTRYYATLNMEVWTEASRMFELAYPGGKRIEFVTELKAANISAYFRTPKEGSSGAYIVRMKAGGTEVSGTVKRSTDSETAELCMAEADTADGQTEATVDAFKAAVESGERVYFTGGVTKANFPDNRKDYATENLPDNMSCDRLMLPGFPNESLADWWKRQTEETKKRLNPTGMELTFSEDKERPWVEETAASKAVGVRQGSVYFDTEDTKNKIDEIYPTLEEMSIGGVRVDVVAKGSAVEDNGVFRDGQTVPNCAVELAKELDIDINELKGSDFAIVMKDGMCAGRTFKVGGSVKKDGRWTLTLQREEDGGVYYPNRDFQINAGDHYVLTGIDMPVKYVEAAAEKLLQYAIAWLGENSKTRYTYTPKVDEIFMARQHDAAMADTTGTLKSLHDTLKEGDVMQFADEDLGIEGMMTIDRLAIREEEGRIATYEITLRDDKEVGTLQRMQEQISSIASGMGGGATAAQMKEIVASEGARHFLSKTHADTAQGEIDFQGGLTARKEARLEDGAQFGESFASGLTGMGGRIDGRGIGELEALRLRRWLEVPELRYNRVEVMVGNQWRAPGGGIVEKVETDKDGEGNELASGTVWLKLEDGEIGKIAADDICMGVWHEGTNVEDNEIADEDDGRGNFKFAGFMTAYWRIEEVMSVDGGTNNAFRYVLRGRTEAFPEPKHPRAMMHFVSYGNFTDEERRQSRYSTLRYERYLKDVKDWEFGAENVAAQFGDLGNLKLWGLDMRGYSAYLNNIYMTGTIQQLEVIPLRMEIENDMDGFLDWGESCTLTCRVMKGWEDRTATVTDWTIMRETGDSASDTAWGMKDKVKGFAGVITLTLGEEENDMGMGQSALFRVVAKTGDGKRTVGEVRV